MNRIAVAFPAIVALTLGAALTGCGSGGPADRETINAPAELPPPAEPSDDAELPDRGEAPAAAAGEDTPPTMDEWEQLIADNPQFTAWKNLAKNAGPGTTTAQWCEITQAISALGPTAGGIPMPPESAKALHWDDAWTGMGGSALASCADLGETQAQMAAWNEGMLILKTQFDLKL